MVVIQGNGLTVTNMRWASLESPASVPKDSYIKVSAGKVVICLSYSLTNEYRRNDIRETSFLLGYFQ